MDDKFHIGSFVRILCFDGVFFEGVLLDFTDQYVIINGYGFPIEDILRMEAA